MIEQFLLEVPATVGSSVERNVYMALLAGTGATRTETDEDMMELIDQGAFKYAGCHAGQLPPTTTDIVFHLEFKKAVSGSFPCSYKNSRPDIRLPLGASTTGTGYEALFDLTSTNQMGHVLKKSDNWIAKANVPFIAEIVWEDSDIMLL